MDTDLQAMTREQLVTEVARLRAGIRAHRGCVRYRESLDAQAPLAPRTGEESGP